MPHLSESQTIETDLFEHRVVGADFINPCCFGQDFAAWLQAQLGHLDGFVLGEPFMEDYGWCFLVKHRDGTISVALSYAHEGPIEGPATWVVTVEWQAAGMLSRWFRPPNAGAFSTFAAAVWIVLRTEPAIALLA
jgi:hypothetical protein